MKKLFFIVIFMWTLAVNAKVTVQVDQNPVRFGETFSITLSQDKHSDGSVPDLSPLQQDFNIVGTERSVSYTVINGQANSLNQWIIMLMPKRAGTVEIPALVIGKEMTQSVKLEVLASDAQEPEAGSVKTGGQQKEMYLTMSVDDESPMLNQQVIYTVKLFNSRRLL